MCFRGKPQGALIAIDRLRDGPAFGPGDQRLLDAFAASAATAIATAESVRPIAADSGSRRELHDETLQSLAALRMGLAAQLRDPNLEAMADAVRETEAQLEEEIGNLRALITDLRPGALDDLGSETAIEPLTERARGRGLEVDLEAAWRALLDVDLLKLGREEPLVGMLGALRMLPEIIGHLLHGERPAKPPDSMRLRDLPSIPMYEGGWILLSERAGHEIALGLVGKFWRPVIEFARITSADEFRDFDEPGFAKTVYDLSVREVGENRTLLSGLMRTATTDERARRWFHRYWTFGVGSGAHILVGALLDSARRAAEGDDNG